MRPRPEHKRAPSTPDYGPRDSPDDDDEDEDDFDERADPREVSTAYQDDEPYTGSAGPGAERIQRGYSYHFCSSNRDLVWSLDEAMDAVIYRSIDEFRQWLRNRSKPQETMGLPFILLKTETKETLWKYFLWWVSVTKQVNIADVRHPTLVNHVMKLRDMWWRFIRHFANSNIERDVELAYDLPRSTIMVRTYGHPPDSRGREELHRLALSLGRAGFAKETSGGAQLRTRGPGPGNLLEDRSKRATYSGSGNTRAISQDPRGSHHAGEIAQWLPRGSGVRHDDQGLAVYHEQGGSGGYDSRSTSSPLGARVQELERLNGHCLERIVALETRQDRLAEEFRRRLNQLESTATQVDDTLTNLRAGIDQLWRGGTVVEGTVQQWTRWSHDFERRVVALEANLRSVQWNPRPDEFRERRRRSRSRSPRRERSRSPRRRSRSRSPLPSPTPTLLLEEDRA
jgi:hypothetical protein